MEALCDTGICAGAKAIESGLVRQVNFLLENIAFPCFSLSAQALDQTLRQ